MQIYIWHVQSVVLLTDSGVKKNYFGENGFLLMTAL